jgi:hypothetical protein
VTPTPPGSTKPGPTTPTPTPPPPPPPPPPTGDTTTGGDTDGGAPPRGGRGTPADARVAGRGGRSTPSALPGWSTWWAFNRLGYLPGRSDLERRRSATTTPRDAAAPAEQLRAEAARRVVVPLLLRTLAEGEAGPQVRAASLLALAKASNDALSIASIDRHLRTAQPEAVVEEAAALAAGLLRRSAPSLQATAEDLDPLRERLLTLLDDDGRRWRTRAFSALALGLLGDQPGGGPRSHDGARIARALWQRLEDGPSPTELEVAILTALGMQPLACTPTRVREGLRDIVIGRRVGRRTWLASERAHALTALARLRVPGWSGWALRSVLSSRMPTAVREAAFLALGAGAADLDADARHEIAGLFGKAVSRARDPHTRGLAWIAAGRLLAAERRDGITVLADHRDVGRDLQRAAQSAPAEERAFAVLGLALAQRGAPDAATLGMLRDRLERDPAGPAYRGVYAVALLLLDGKAAGPDLLRVLKDDGADPGVRSLCALALGVLGDADEATRRALATAVYDRGFPELAGEAALALSMLPQGSEAVLLAGRLDDRGPEHLRARLAVALGRLADLRAVDDLVSVARSVARSDETRALAIASLGLLVDPEPVPSLFRLTQDANYPARTDALHEAFTIL